MSHRLLPAKPPALGRGSLRKEEGARAIMRSTWCALAGVATAQLLVPPKKMVFRTRDPLTNATSQGWRKALSIDGFPTFMGVAEANEKSEDDVLAAMRWFIVPETGVVLLNPLVPLHYIYRHQHNAVVGSV